MTFSKAVDYLNTQELVQVNCEQCDHDELIAVRPSDDDDATFLAFVCAVCCHPACIVSIDNGVLSVSSPETSFVN